ncbi:type II secretion system F family protein [Thauera sp. JM12B12]|uniref:type II secretion system F family protein n=1 Tax=Thauera sp. JM12B12 TaxID=3142262 RepID=UPI0031F368C5
MNLAPLLLAVALTVALLAWSLADLGSRLLTAWRQRFTRETGFRLRELFLFVDPARLYALNLAVTMLAAGLGWLASGSLALALIIGLLLAISPGAIFRWLRARRLERIEQQLPDALQMLAGTARAGLSLPAAIRQVSTELAPPLQQEWLLLQHEQRLGVTLDDALENLALRVPVQPVKLMVSAMRIASETGGGLAETLERTATTLRSQHAMELKIRALTAQGKLQAWVVGLLPVFLLWVLARLEPDAMALLWSTRLGWGVLAAVLVMEIIGVVLIRRIVSIDI